MQFSRESFPMGISCIACLRFGRAFMTHWIHFNRLFLIFLKYLVLESRITDSKMNFMRLHRVILYKKWRHIEGTWNVAHIRLSCCPWAMSCGQKDWASVTVPPAPVRVPGQSPFAPSVTSVTSVSNDKGDKWQFKIGKLIYFISKRFMPIFISVLAFWQICPTSVTTRTVHFCTRTHAGNTSSSQPAAAASSSSNTSVSIVSKHRYGSEISVKNKITFISSFKLKI